MKKILLFPILALLFACDTDDDGYYNVEYIDAAESLVSVEPEASYAVNDVVYVNAEVPFLLTEAGNPNPIDVLRTTGNAPSFEFSYALQKQVGTEWEIVDLTGDFVADTGTGQSGFYVLAKTALGETGYQFRGGIRLTETGTFRIAFNTNSDDLSLATLRSNSPGSNIILNVYSAIGNTTGGTYTFTVE